MRASAPLLLGVLALAAAVAALVVAVSRDDDPAPAQTVFEVELDGGRTEEALRQDGLTITARCRAGDSPAVTTILGTEYEHATLSFTTEWEAGGRSRTEHESVLDFAPDKPVETPALEGPYLGMGLYYQEERDVYSTVHLHAWVEPDGRCYLVGVTA